MPGFKLSIIGHDDVTTSIEVSIEEEQLPLGVCLMRVSTTGDKKKGTVPRDETKEVHWSVMAKWVADTMISVLCGFRTREEYEAHPGLDPTLPDES